MFPAEWAESEKTAIGWPVASGVVLVARRSIRCGDVWPRGWEVIALLSRLIGIIVAILIIVWIVSNPAAAGDSVHGWIAGLFTFFRHLSSAEPAPAASTVLSGAWIRL
jgi:hypothetical protein